MPIKDFLLGYAFLVFFFGLVAAPRVPVGRWFVWTVIYPGLGYGVAVIVAVGGRRGIALARALRARPKRSAIT